MWCSHHIEEVLRRPEGMYSFKIRHAIAEMQLSNFWVEGKLKWSYDIVLGCLAGLARVAFVYLFLHLLCRQTPGTVPSPSVDRYPKY